MDPSAGLSLTFSPEKNVVVFTSILDSNFWVIGASVPWVGKKGSWTDSASFVVDPRDKKGVIAIATAVKIPRGKYCDSHVQVFLLPISWQKDGQDDNGNPVDLGRAWVPPKDRMLWVEHNAERYSTEIVLKLRAEDRTFVTSTGIPGTFYAPDADLLCRFAAGVDGITEDDLLHNATETKKEQGASVELENARQQIKQLEEARDGCSAGLSAWRNRALALQSSLLYKISPTEQRFFVVSFFRRLIVKRLGLKNLIFDRKDRLFWSEDDK